MPAKQLVETLIAKKLTITTAESCTGGLIAARITDISGSSAVFEQGVVSYANSVKTKLLGVEPQALHEHGAVSSVVAQQMVSGAKQSSGADIAVAVTGIAGPTGGSPEKPVGLVFIGVAYKDVVQTERFVFQGDREHIRKQAVAAAIELAQLAANSFSV